MTTATYRIATEQEFPHGLSCLRCHRSIPFGTPYQDVITTPGKGDMNEQPESAASSVDAFRNAVAGAGIGETVCVYCVGEEA